MKPNAGRGYANRGFPFDFILAVQQLAGALGMTMVELLAEVEAGPKSRRDKPKQ